MKLLTQITFGPVPSRRLGRSLGINNIPPKVCSYSCVYCQVGRTLQYSVIPMTFYGPGEIEQQVAARLKVLRGQREKVDYLTFVPDGEPTLDGNLGETIKKLSAQGVKIAVITNGSLLWRPEVRRNLQKADFVSVKLDSVNESIWRKINRPQESLQLPTILEGIAQFAREYPGVLATETMLVDKFNTAAPPMTATADFIAEISPRTAYLSIPTRPPAEKWVQPPRKDDIVMAYQIMQERISTVECLIEYEEENFITAGDFRDELLSILAVHPLREGAVAKLLADAGADSRVIDELLQQKKITTTEYQGRKFYLKEVNHS